MKFDGLPFEVRQIIFMYVFHIRNENCMRTFKILGPLLFRQFVVQYCKDVSVETWNNIISRQPICLEMLWCLYDRIHYYHLSSNPWLPSNVMLMYQNRLNWLHISRSRYIPFETGDLFRFADRLNFAYVLLNSGLTDEQVNMFMVKIDWTEVSLLIDDFELMEKYKAYLDWFVLSSRSIYRRIQDIDRFKDYIEFDRLNMDVMECIPRILTKYTEKLDWYTLSYCYPFTSKQIRLLAPYIHWNLFQMRSDIPQQDMDYYLRLVQHLK